MRNLNDIFRNIVHKFEEVVNCERRVQPWLKKQADALALYKDDPDRALALLADGLQDEIDFIEESL